MNLPTVTEAPTREKREHRPSGVPGGIDHSAIYAGRVRHRRHGPHPHRFSYRLFMVYLDLDELDAVLDLSPLWSRGRRNLAEFRRSDYLAPGDRSLKSAVLDRIEAETGKRPAGGVRMLTHLRYFGYCFNPVTFYYAFDSTGDLDAIVAEITNTPWKERHCYVLPVTRADRHGGSYEFGFDKAFHVSPFLDMDLHYDWRFSLPGERLSVHMNVSRDSTRQFDATLTLERQPVTRAGLQRVLLRFPLMTVRVVGAIHWQALKLWLKRNPVYTHPKKRDRNP